VQSGGSFRRLAARFLGAGFAAGFALAKGVA